MNKKLRDIYGEITIKKHSPTTDEDLLKAVNTTITPHTEFKNIKNIDDIIKNDACIIFYDHTAGNIGHWCCLTKRGNIIEFFDPYGRNIDSPKYMYLGRPQYLKNLLRKSKYDVRYNPFDFQGTGTSTCGRHVVTRILFKDKPLEEYKKIMSGINADDFVSFVTLPI